MDRRSNAELPSQLGVKGVVPIKQMKGDDAEDAALLAQMEASALEYLSSFDWCSSVRDAYFGDGYGGIVAVFLFRIVPARPSTDEWLWVVVGDLPSAHMRAQDLKNPYEVLREYIRQRALWAEYASRGEAPPEAILPVQVIPPTPHWANEMKERLDVLRENFLEHFRKE
jgi:hypothetical protein